MAYDAITIDTSTFVQSGIALETGLLAQLEQFKHGPVDLILSEIVTRELLKHLNVMTRKGRDQALSALTRLEQLQLVPEADRPQLKALGAAILDSREAARSRVARFAEATGAKNVAASLCSVDDVLKLYFATGAPFEPSGDKKSEFPDAMALLSLQKWAATSGKRILAVSADKGWADFAASSEQIDVQPDLAKALEILQNHAGTAEARVAALMAAIEAGELPDAAKMIEHMLESALSDWDFLPEGHGSFHLEADSRELQFGAYEVARIGDAYDITVVRLGNETIVARIGVSFSATATAEFSLSIWDSIDREYVGMGSSAAEKEIEFEGAFLITLLGDPAGPLADFDIGEIEIVEAIDSVDFGEIELDYGDEDDFESLLGPAAGEDRSSPAADEETPF